MNPQKLIKSIREKYPQIQIIGEVKPISPFDPERTRSRVVIKRRRFELLNRIMDLNVDMISIHTDEMWGGGFGWLEEAVKYVKKTFPILAKGFNPTEAHISYARELGADEVHVVGWDGGPGIWVELSTWTEFMEFSSGHVMINSRDPRTGESQFTDDLIQKIADHGTATIIQASNIKSVDDVDEDVDYVLIGTALCQ